LIFISPNLGRTGQAFAGDRIVGRNGAGDAGAKDVLAARNEIPVLVFDEVEAEAWAARLRMRGRKDEVRSPPSASAVASRICRKSRPADSHYL